MGSLQRRSRLWWFAMVRRLFVRVGEPEQPAFVPRSSEDRHARRRVPPRVKPIGTVIAGKPVVGA